LSTKIEEILDENSECVRASCKKELKTRKIKEDESVNPFLNSNRKK
jgi:hypothetical protein